MKWIVLGLMLLSPQAFAQCTLQPLQGDLDVALQKGGVMRSLQYRITCEQPTQGQLTVEGVSNGEWALKGRQHQLPVNVSIEGQPAHMPYLVQAGKDGVVVEIQLHIPNAGYRFQPDEYKEEMTLKMTY